MTQFAVRVNNRESSRLIQKIAHDNGWTRKNGSTKIANTRSECIAFPASSAYPNERVFGFSSEHYYRAKGIEILDADRDLGEIYSRLGRRITAPKTAAKRWGFFGRVLDFFS